METLWSEEVLTSPICIFKIWHFSRVVLISIFCVQPSPTSDATRVLTL